MISYYRGDVYLTEENIIYNPVGVRDNNKGFIRKVRALYPEVYECYKDKTWTSTIRELTADVQLVQISEKKLIMNGYCKEKDGSFNFLWFTKTLIELVNLAYEYELSVEIEYGLGFKDKARADLVMRIIQEVFSNTDIEVKIYKRKK